MSEKLTLEILGSNVSAKWHYNPEHGPANVVNRILVAADSFIGNNVTINEGSIIEPDAMIGSNVVIGAMCSVGPSAIIGAGSTLGNAVDILDKVIICGGVTIGSETRIVQSIIGEGTKIGSNVDIWLGANIGEHSLIEEGSSIPPGIILPDYGIFGSQKFMICYSNAQDRKKFKNR